MVRIIRLSLACLLLAVVGTSCSDAHIRKGTHNQERGPGGAPHEADPYSKHPSIALINAPGDAGAAGDDNAAVAAFANMIHDVFGWDVVINDNQKDLEHNARMGTIQEKNVLSGVGTKLKVEEGEVCSGNDECLSGCCVDGRCGDEMQCF